MTVDKMSRVELRAAAKAAGIKYGKMSLMQIREALKDAKPVAKKEKVRAERTGTKMEAAIELVKSNSGLNRAGMLKLFQDKAKLTKAGAATYYSLVMKKLK